MDLYIGFDVSVASSAMCGLSEKGKLVKEATSPTEPEELVKALHALPGRVVAVALEAGPLSQWLYQHLTEAGFPTVLMETRQVKGALQAMPIKTDRCDAEGIARLLQMAGSARSITNPCRRRKCAHCYPRAMRSNKLFHRWSCQSVGCCAISASRWDRWPRGALNNGCWS